MHLKSGREVYLPGENIAGSLIRRGWVRLKLMVWSRENYEAWLVEYLDNRYEMEVQRVFNTKDFSSNQLTQNEEVVMATRKTPKKVVKKAAKKVAKKVVKKAAKKVAKKSPQKPAVKRAVRKSSTEDKTATKKSPGISRSKLAYELISQQKLTDSQIVEEMQKAFPNMKCNDTGAVRFYRRNLNEGKAPGYPAPEEEYAAIGGSKQKAKSEDAEEEKTPAVRRVRRKK